MFDFALQAVDGFVFLAQKSGGFDNLELMFKGRDERRSVFEHHALQGFKVEMEFANLFLLGEEEFVKVLIHVHIPGDTNP
jgi:hypothetical protein